MLSAQHIDFRYLGPEDGMRSMSALQACIDGFGHIWVSTVDGLVRYNGSSIDHFSAELYKFMPSESFGHVYCDSKNQIWFCSNKGILRIDEIRQFNPEVVIPDDPEKDFRFCFENSRGEVTALTSNRTFTRDPKTGVWTPQPWLDTLINGMNYRDLAHMSRDTILLTSSNKGVLVFNALTKEKIALLEIKNVQAAEAISDHEIVFGRSGRFQLYYVDLRHPDQAIPIPTPDFLSVKDPKAEIEYMAIATDSNIYISTQGLGLVQYNPRTKLFRLFSHDPIDPYSVADDYLRHIVADDKGNLVITCLKGINFTNVAGTNIQFLSSFQTEDGDVLDDRVISIAEDHHHRLWLASLNDLLIYEEGKPYVRRLNIPTTSPLYSPFPYPFYMYADTIRRQMWVSMFGKGIAVFDEDEKLVHELSGLQYPGYDISINETRIIREGSDGMLYIGTTGGFFRIHPESMAIDTFPDDTALYAIRHRRIVDLLQFGDELWITISPNGAAFRYDFSTKQLKRFSVKEGLSSVRPYAIARDENGVILIGAHIGLNLILPNDSIISFISGRGLLSSRIDAIQRGKDGALWLANSYNLLHYDANTRKLNTIIGEPHLSEVGFQIMSSATLSNGRLAFGVHEGIIIVDPGVRKKSNKEFELVVFYRNAQAHEIPCRAGTVLKLGTTERDIRFRFAITNLILSSKMLYRYRIGTTEQGAWSEPTSIAQVNFNLQPGQYTFEVEAFNGEAWISSGPVTIAIPYPWWQRWWVISLTMLFLIAAVAYYWRNRLLKYKHELAIARQIGELESKALRAQMNPHFVFNSLNAIQECIVTEKFDEAYAYLSKFSRLLRLVLEHSDRQAISLQEELEVLTLYISLEKLRFRDDMQVTMDIDEQLDAEEVMIPPMLLQPHIENAIWHGLRHKEGDKHLTVRIHEREAGYIDVSIEDNGIGREQAGVIKKSRLGQQKYESKGSKLSGKRMEVLRAQYSLTAMHIDDLFDAHGRSAGTRVQLAIPILTTPSEKRTLINT